MIGKFRLVVVFMLVAFAATACGGDLPESKSLPKLSRNIQLTEPQLEAMFKLVRTGLALYPDMEKALKLPKDPALPDLCDTDIAVTVFNEGNPQITGIGFQGCAHERILRAVYKLTLNPEFSRKYLLKLKSTKIKIDVVTYRNKLNLKKLKKVKVEPGVYGLMVMKNEEPVYQLPSDFIHFGWEPESHSRLARIKKQLSELMTQAALPDDAWKELPIYRIFTLSYLQNLPDEPALPLYRANILIKNITPTHVEQSAVAAGKWLINHIEPTDRFTHNFNPVTRETPSFFTFSPTAHAGCAYSLIYLYNRTLEPKFLEGGERALRFLQRHMRQPVLEPEILSVQHPIFNTSELSASAMTLMAFCELPEAQFSQIGIETANRLARFILEMQLDDGHFYEIYYHKLAGYQPKSDLRYFEGEALLALVRYYKKNPNLQWLESARLAAGAQIDLFEKSGVANYWTVQALAELYSIDPTPTYAKSALKMADALLDDMYVGKPYPDYEGGFKPSHPPRTSSSAGKIEALISASRLSQYLGEDTSKYDHAVMEGTRFLIWNQYRPDNSYWVATPEQVEGAIRDGLIDVNVYANTMRHTVAALAGAIPISKNVAAEEQAEEEAQEVE